MEHLDRLEATSIHIIRESYANFKNLGMLWSIGKDSTVLLWLVKKAFFGHVPFPLIHIDTHYKIPEMIEYRDRLTKEWHLNMVVGVNEEALAQKATFPDGNVDRITCCRNLKTQALKATLDGTGKRYIFNHAKGCYEIDKSHEAFTAIILGIRSDEEGSRSKERYFSPRNASNEWNIGDQPPEFWKTRLQRFFTYFCQNFKFAHYAQTQFVNAAGKGNDALRQAIKEFFIKCPEERFFSFAYNPFLC